MAEEEHKKKVEKIVASSLSGITELQGEEEGAYDEKVAEDLQEKWLKNPYKIQELIIDVEHFKYIDTLKDSGLMMEDITEKMTTHRKPFAFFVARGTKAEVMKIVGKPWIHGIHKNHKAFAC
jgi:hypothetical protein